MNKAIIPIILLLLSATGIYLLRNDQRVQLSQFSQWKIQYHIQYSSEMEQMYRERVFNENMEMILAHNANPHKTYQMGVNQFTAMTKQQFIQLHLVSIIKNTEPVQILLPENMPNVDVDWSQMGAVAPVKNQGQCSASWAFSVVGGLEGLSKIAYGVLKRFSQQQLVDCSSAYGNRGCGGGYPSNGYKYVIDHGICTDDEYPYKGVASTCKNCTNPFKISGVTQVSSCDNLIKGIQKQPVSVTVDATNWATYRSGILSNCGTSLNHATLLVGLVGGVWKVKNSWGAAWGQNGYIRLAAGNTCGICMSAAYPNK